MRVAKVTEKLAAAAAVLALSCAGNHRVSPWGGGEPPPPAALAQPADLDAQLRTVDQETAALGLTPVAELRGRLPRGGGVVVARGYEGVDRVNRPTTATRVATSRGVVLSVGPLALGDLDRARATELLTSPLGGEPPGEGLVTGNLADLNGDGDPDVVLRSEVGTLEVWALRLFSSAAYPIELGVAPTLALDADGDGRMDLAGRPLPLAADPIAPDLLEVATFEAGRYSSRSAAARAFHARRAGLGQASAPPAPASPTAAASSAAPAPPPPDDPTRLRRALERAWHAALAGEPAKELLARLDRERVPPELEQAFAAHRVRIARVARARETTPKEKAARTPAGT